MNKKNIFIITFLLLVSAILRVKLSNYPSLFWVDEFSSVSQANLIIEIFKGDKSVVFYSLENNNYLTHLLIAMSFSIIGKSVLAAKIPFMIIGSFVPIMIYFVGDKYFNKMTGFLSGILSVFLYFFITWSQQARGYVLQQFLVLALLYVYYDIYKMNSLKYKKNMVAFLIISIFGILTHLSFIFIIAALVFHFTLFNFKIIYKYLKNHKYLSFFSGFILFLLLVNQFSFLFSKLSFINNFPYYHSFLWREYKLISFLFIIGSLLVFFGKQQKIKLSLFFIIVFNLIFFVFLFPPYSSRYLLSSFPLIIIFAGFALLNIANIINKQYSNLIAIFITLIILLSGDKFTIKPKPFYSINHDFREIALIDYAKNYLIIKSQLNLDNNIAVIDTWPDRIKWYLGPNTNNNQYVFRWLNEPGDVNGLEKRTDYLVNEFGEKILPKSGKNPIKLIGELNDLLITIEKFNKGYIWIDDQSMPRDVIQYVENNFQIVHHLNRFELDDNPYSIWPGTLYSWSY